MKTLLLIWLVVLWSFFLFGGVHPASPNKLCARPGCEGHYHQWHANGNGPCLYFDATHPAGHCPGFVK